MQVVCVFSLRHHRNCTPQWLKRSLYKRPKYIFNVFRGYVFSPPEVINVGVFCPYMATASVLDNSIRSKERTLAKWLRCKVCDVFFLFASPWRPISLLSIQHGCPPGLPDVYIWETGCDVAPVSHHVLAAIVACGRHHDGTLLHAASSWWRGASRRRTEQHLKGHRGWQMVPFLSSAKQLREQNYHRSAVLWLFGARGLEPCSICRVW